MLRVETDADFDAIRRDITQLFPDIRIRHIHTDHALKELGFAEKPICVFVMDMTLDEFESMMDELSQLEVDAFNTSDGSLPEKDDPLYQRYRRFGWLWDMFYNARIEEVSAEDLTGEWRNDNET